MKEFGVNYVQATLGLAMYILGCKKPFAPTKNSEQLNNTIQMGSALCYGPH